MAKVQLPPGCYGFECKDGTKYTGKPGTSVDVSDRHAEALKKSQFGGDGHLIGHVGRLSIGTKDGKWCRSCNRLWNVWNSTCPKCGTATESEAEMASMPGTLVSPIDR